MFKAGDTIKINGEFTVEDVGTHLCINGWPITGSLLKALGAVKVRKSYTEGELNEKFGELNNVHLQNLTLKALYIMQKDNSRPIVNCIYMAMGYKKDSEKENTWYKVGEE